MNGFGQNKYSLLKSKPTLIIFALLVVAGVGTRFVDVPYLALVALPVNIVYSATNLGSILGNIGGTPLSTAGQVAFYYLFAVIIGFGIHKVASGRSNSFP